MSKNLYLRPSILFCFILLGAVLISERNTGGKMLNRVVASEGHSVLAESDFAKSSLVLGENYRIFDKDGNPVALAGLIEKIKEVDVTFLGETHTDSVAHLLQALVLKETSDANQALSLEMFERDVQYVVNEYLAGLISEEHFLKSARPWDNYSSDYRELIEFSKESGLSVIAANAPRRYVNMVRRLGQESLLSLSTEAKESLPPLPYSDVSLEYERKFRAIMTAHHSMIQSVTQAADTIDNQDEKDDLDSSQVSSEQASSMDESAFKKMLEAQNLWDASMAWSIASYLKRHPNSRVIHINGNFHTDYSLGIPEHLNYYVSDIRTLIVAMVPSFDYPNFSPSMKGLGDFIIVTNGKLEPSH